MAFGDRSKSSDPVDVAALVDQHNMECVWAWVQAGAMVTFSTTRDRGVMSCTVTVDGEWERGYFRTSSEFGEWIGEWHTTVMDELEKLSASDEAGKRRRRR